MSAYTLQPSPPTARARATLAARPALFAAVARDGSSGTPTFNRPLELTTDAVLRSKGLGPVLEKSVQGLVGLTHDAAQWSVRHEQVLARFRQAGHAHVLTHADLISVDLEAVDAHVARLAVKYKALRSRMVRRRA